MNQGIAARSSSHSLCGKGFFHCSVVGAGTSFSLKRKGFVSSLASDVPMIEGNIFSLPDVNSFPNFSGKVEPVPHNLRWPRIHDSTELIVRNGSRLPVPRFRKEPKPETGHIEQFEGDYFPDRFPRNWSRMGNKILHHLPPSQALPVV
jgi:hypothetical protein